MSQAEYKFDSLKFRKVSEDALVPAAEYIRGAILGEVDLSEYLIKGDKTAVTIVDKRSEEISRSIILEGFPELGLRQEETKGVLGNPDSPIRLYHDPLDGTGEFLMGGATPTIILAAYNSTTEEVLACSTMEPSTGRFWFSSKGNGAFLKKYDYYEKKFDSEDGKQIHVNRREGLDGSHVLVDVDHSFTKKTPLKKNSEVLYPEGRRELSRAIENFGGKVASFYTNGGHYAYVAMGRPTLVGCVTTAIGGPFDIAGIRHVIEAGGVARGYRIWDDSTNLEMEGYGKPGKRSLRRNFNVNESREKTYQNIEEADLVIAANSEANLERLETILGRAVYVEDNDDVKTLKPYDMLFEGL